MTTEAEVWQCARMLVEGYGADAEYSAATQVDKMASRRDPAGVAMWTQVLGAVRELQRARRWGERLH